jgi:chromate transporter
MAYSRGVLRVTVALEAEVALLFLGAGIVGIFLLRTIFNRGGPSSLLALASVAVGTTKTAIGSTLGQLLAFFLKAGSLTFGTGLVIVPFLEKELV